jgi:pyrroline-5-carboxylate reductase
MQIIDNIICFGNLDDRSIVNTISSSIGSCEGEIDENLLNVVTALSGSGPAYVS